MRDLLAFVFLIAAFATLLFLGEWAAYGQDVHHHEGMSPEVDKFYSTWYMPDNRNLSCCNKTDCYPTEAHFEHGQWWALHRESNEFIPIPVNKVEQERDNPDGRSHICASPWKAVYCFIPGGGA